MTCKNYIETVVATMGANNTPVEYQILSAHGKNMPVRSNPLNGTMALGQCYQNAYRLMDNRSMTYCEGYAAIKGLGIPIAHAWVVDSDGFVIDPTWKDGTEYFGVRFEDRKSVV